MPWPCQATLALAWFCAMAFGKQMTKVDPVSVGFVRSVNLSGTFRSMKTLSLDPPVFLISQFLSAAEADAIVHSGKANGLGESRVSREERHSFPPGGRAFQSLFGSFDEDGDDALDSNELAGLLGDAFDMHNHAADDFETLLHRHGITGPTIAREAFVNKGIDLGEYVSWLTGTKPHLQSRFSNQAWLPYRLPSTAVLKERAAAVTQLPLWVIRGAEDLQVLRYSTRGHYSCHHDSSPDNLEAGESVRLATIALFLNDPPRGGEIAFPGADHPDAGMYGDDEWGDFEKECQPTHKCTTMGGVVVAPKKGDAVFWYNMKVEKWSDDGKETPGVEALYWNSLHCGAEVKEGEKWMANMWLNSRPSVEESEQVSEDL